MMSKTRMNGDDDDDDDDDDADALFTCKCKFFAFFLLYIISSLIFKL